VNKFNIILKKAIFISPFLEGLKNAKNWQFDVVNRTFHKTNFDWEKLKKLIRKSYVIYGEKDPYVPTRLPLDFAAKMSSTVVPIKNGGHLGGELKEFPLLIDIINE
jgi:predicted alpha/beta hydrolase family esterase